MRRPLPSRRLEDLMIDLESSMRIALVITATAVSATAVGCAVEGSPTEELAIEAVAQPIVNGQAATSYTEAALINGPGFICSGAIIAPRVALTAGHCVPA